MRQGIVALTLALLLSSTLIASIIPIRRGAGGGGDPCSGYTPVGYDIEEDFESASISEAGCDSGTTEYDWSASSNTSTVSDCDYGTAPLEGSESLWSGVDVKGGYVTFNFAASTDDIAMAGLLKFETWDSGSDSSYNIFAMDTTSRCRITHYASETFGVNGTGCAAEVDTGVSIVQGTKYYFHIQRDKSEGPTCCISIQSSNPSDTGEWDTPTCCTSDNDGAVGEWRLYSGGHVTNDIMLDALFIHKSADNTGIDACEFDGL
jgi:hypothetical protein